MSEMISFGGGVNSVAMTIMLVNEGWRGPVVFADTGGEHPETYCYMEYFEREWLKPRGMEVVRICYDTHPHLYRHDKRIGSSRGSTLWEYCYAAGIIPLLANRWCSVTFKRGPMEAFRKERGIDVSLVGICADEMQRVRDDPSVRYPLVDHDVTRQGCKDIIKAEGLTVPRKSGCFFCPGQRASSWRDLFYHQPDLYEKAAELERHASERSHKWATLDPHGNSLDQMREHRWEGQMEMDLSEWLPCICTL